MYILCISIIFYTPSHYFVVFYNPDGCVLRCLTLFILQFSPFPPHPPFFLKQRFSSPQYFTLYEPLLTYHRSGTQITFPCVEATQKVPFLGIGTGRTEASKLTLLSSDFKSTLRTKLT